MNTPLSLSESDISRIIEMAWEDRTPFEAIAFNYHLSEKEVIALMRKELKATTFKVWRARVTQRATKHMAKRAFDVGRSHCRTQYKSLTKAKSKAKQNRYRGK